MEKKNDYINVPGGGCPLNMEEQVLGLADGTVTGEPERDRILAHMAVCPFCSRLFSDFLDHSHELYMTGAAATEEIEGPLVGIELAGGALRSLSPGWLTTPAAAVLDRSYARALEFAVPGRSGQLVFRVICVEGSVTIQVPDADRSDRFLLIGKDRKELSFSRDGSVVYDRVEPGRYFLVVNGRRAVTLEIEGVS